MALKDEIMIISETNGNNMECIIDCLLQYAELKAAIFTGSER
jgi:hypothetical protein